MLLVAIKRKFSPCVTSKNKGLMKRGKYVTCGSLVLKLNSSKMMLPVGVSVIQQSTSFSLIYIYRDIILLDLVQNLISDWMQTEHQKKCSISINRVDNAAYPHDLCYSIHNDTKSKNEVCDNLMLAELDGIVNPTLRKRFD